METGEEGRGRRGLAHRFGEMRGTGSSPAEGGPPQTTLTPWPRPRPRTGRIQAGSRASWVLRQHVHPGDSPLPRGPLAGGRFERLPRQTGPERRTRSGLLARTACRCGPTGWIGERENPRWVQDSLRRTGDTSFDLGTLSGSRAGGAGRNRAFPLPQAVRIAHRPMAGHDNRPFDRGQERSQSRVDPSAVPTGGSSPASTSHALTAGVVRRDIRVTLVHGPSPCIVHRGHDPAAGPVSLPAPHRPPGRSPPPAAWSAPEGGVALSGTSGQHPSPLPSP